LIATITYGNASSFLFLSNSQEAYSASSMLLWTGDTSGFKIVQYIHSLMSNSLSKALNNTSVYYERYIQECRCFL